MTEVIVWGCIILGLCTLCGAAAQKGFTAFFFLILTIIFLSGAAFVGFNKAQTATYLNSTTIPVN